MIHLFNMFPSPAQYRWLWRTPVGLALVVSFTGVLGYSFWVLLGGYDPDLEDVVSSLGLAGLHFLVFIFGVQYYRNGSHDMRIRRGWLLIALACLSNSIAEFLWMYNSRVLGIEPFPSVADYFYLLFYPLVLIGVLVMPYAPVRRSERIILWLDLGILMASSAMVFWFFILHPMVIDPNDLLAGWIAVAYPVGDLLLFAGVIAIIQRDAEKTARGSMFFLAEAIIFTTLADVLFAYYDVHGVDYSLPYLNVLWLASGLCFLAGLVRQIKANQPGDVTVPQKTAYRVLRLMLPYVGASIGPLLLIIIFDAQNSDMQIARSLLHGTIGLVGLVLLRQYTVLVENVRLFNEMQRLAMTDSLTGVYNRHFFNETLQNEVDRARRFNKNLSVLLIDVDRFKMINDTYGHLQGDRVLRLIASVLKSQLRKMDVLARFGGDEFAIILPEADPQQAALVAIKIQQAVESDRQFSMPLSISVGQAQLARQQTPEQFLEAADHDLYRSKAEKGRSRGSASPRIAPETV